ncbi:MAG: hypothetical protein ACRENU_10515 [Gemmatimonadaceae bacterium]
MNLGERLGRLSDAFTQRWVRFTGKRIDLREAPWLDAPVGSEGGIPPTFIDDLARSEKLSPHRAPDIGLLPDFDVLASPSFDAAAADPGVVEFYARTSRYELDSWAEWCGAFRPFGAALALIFSRRLQQLNVPLSGLDTSRGVTSEVVHLADPKTGAVRFAVWLRRLVHTGNVLYAGCYSVARVPGYAGLCVRVVFPLPNGNAMVFMRPELRADGSVVVVSSGDRLGDPGFYFTVRAGPHHVWVKYLRSLRESIRVYPAEPGTVRADHGLTLWRLRVLDLHYRLRAATGSLASHGHPV